MEHQQLPEKTEKPRKIRGMGKVCVNPFFLEFSERTSDPYWAEKFRLAAHGKFPSGFSCQNKTLFCRKKKKNFQLDLNSNIDQAVNDSINFFRTHAGLVSPIDKQNYLDFQNNREEKICRWGEVGKRMQSCLIANYISDLVIRYNLNKQEFNKLKSLLDKAVSEKTFNKKHIVIEDNRIVEITGLQWISEVRIFEIDPSLSPQKNKSKDLEFADFYEERITDKDYYPQFDSRWENYLGLLNKKHSKYNMASRSGDYYSSK